MAEQIGRVVRPKVFLDSQKTAQHETICIKHIGLNCEKLSDTSPGLFICSFELKCLLYISHSELKW